MYKNKNNKNVDKNDTDNKAAKKKIHNRKIPLDTMITIQSNVVGSLGYVSQNKDLYIELSEYGDIDHVTLSDLSKIRNAYPRYFDDNWIVLINVESDDYELEDVYEFLRIKDKYNLVFSPDDIDKLFSKPADQLKDIISKYSSGYKDTIHAIALKKHKNGTLSNLNKIKAISEATGKEIYIED